MSQQSATTMTFEQILAISVGEKNAPVKTAYRDVTGVELVRDMPCTLSNPPTDAEMIVSCVQSGAMGDDNYIWADATELQKWIFEELIKRLNHFLDQADAVLATKLGYMPDLIREDQSRHVTRALVKWCRHLKQRRVHFRAFDERINRLSQFDLERELSIYEMMTLIGEIKGEIDGTLPAEGPVELGEETESAANLPDIEQPERPDQAPLDMFVFDPALSAVSAEDSVALGNETQAATTATDMGPLEGLDLDMSMLDPTLFAVSVGLGDQAQAATTAATIDQEELDQALLDMSAIDPALVAGSAGGPVAGDENKAMTTVTAEEQDELDQALLDMSTSNPPLVAGSADVPVALGDENRAPTTAVAMEQLEGVDPTLPDMSEFDPLTLFAGPAQGPVALGDENKVVTTATAMEQLDRLDPTLLNMSAFDPTPFAGSSFDPPTLFTGSAFDPALTQPPPGTGANTSSHDKRMAEEEVTPPNSKRQKSGPSTFLSQDLDEEAQFMEPSDQDTE